MAIWKPVTGWPPSGLCVRKGLTDFDFLIFNVKSTSFFLPVFFFQNSLERFFLLLFPFIFHINNLTTLYWYHSSFSHKTDSWDWFHLKRVRGYGESSTTEREVWLFERVRLSGCELDISHPRILFTEIFRQWTRETGYQFIGFRVDQSTWLR